MNAPSPPAYPDNYRQGSNAGTLHERVYLNEEVRPFFGAVGDTGIAFRDIAGMIGQRLSIPSVSIPAEDAMSHFGFLGQIVGADNPASSEITCETLGWQPTHPSLLQDLSSDFYFA